ncbi:amino acid permease [Caulobacter sp. 17J65-9]|uniref:amino acid permease n=1 Tax=Caulobacter sp. 17J65-9 TaxID=2709382 RepID=UPI0013C7D85E|nr:amino acid permease [Caulobacter sp. 17J65-9]NEX95087.1 amino acid permease [Caulobacter sp. 17J65-9]
MAFWNRTKPIDTAHEQEGAHQLRKTLSWPHLVALGVGAIVGTGIYTLIGTGAGLAGPGVILSFAIAGVVCVCAALAYAEMATMIPASGSAYTYTYSALGELLAWIVGVSLILEYTVVCSAVAVGWAGYATGFLESMGVHLPTWLSTGWMADHHIGETFVFDPNKGLISLPAIFISLAVASLLALGTRESATINSLLVVFKIAALAVFVAIALPHFDPANFQPFMPNGFLAHDGVRPDGTTGKVGVMAAAAIIFFAFYGFDAVSTAAEETKNPKRDLTIGIVGSMAVCTVLYMLIGAAALGAMHFDQFAKSTEPLALIMRTLDQPMAARIVAAAAVVALPTVILAFMYGQSRIFFVMARDGLLPRSMSKVSAKTGTPVVMTFFTAIVVSVIAGVFPLGEIASVANAGTLAAFIAVAVSMMVLRVKDPTRPRVFKAPLPWVIGPVAVLGCLYLFTSLSGLAQKTFFICNGIGLVVYFAYAMWNSRLAKRA